MLYDNMVATARLGMSALRPGVWALIAMIVLCYLSRFGDENERLLYRRMGKSSLRAFLARKPTSVLAWSRNGRGIRMVLLIFRCMVVSDFERLVG